MRTWKRVESDKWACRQTDRWEQSDEDRERGQRIDRGDAGNREREGGRERAAECRAGPCELFCKIILPGPHGLSRGFYQIFKVLTQILYIVFYKAERFTMKSVLSCDTTTNII